MSQSDRARASGYENDAVGNLKRLTEQNLTQGAAMTSIVTMGVVAVCARLADLTDAVRENTEAMRER